MYSNSKNHPWRKYPTFFSTATCFTSSTQMASTGCGSGSRQHLIEMDQSGMRTHTSSMVEPADVSARWPITKRRSSSTLYSSIYLGHLQPRKFGARCRTIWIVAWFKTLRKLPSAVAPPNIAVPNFGRSKDYRKALLFGHLWIVRWQRTKEWLRWLPSPIIHYRAWQISDLQIT